MKETQINYLNVILMVVSAVFAILFPFELFLFSFVFMAPLHYLTEISWLEKKQFFIKSKSQILMIVVGTLFILSHHFFSYPTWIDAVNTGMFVLLVVAVSLYLFDDWKIHLGVALASIAWVVGFKWHRSETYLVIFTVFLPTIIHITLFTFIFILSGVRKNWSASGVISLLVFLVCSFCYFMSPLFPYAYTIHPWVKDLYFEFIVLNKKISDFFGYGQINNLDDIYYSKTGISIMQYIAFSYTYHFLNWFSKTSIIGWHRVDMKILAGLGGTYLVILAVIAYNFNWGMYILSVLGLAHMYLELPLNFHSFKSIFKKSYT